MRRLGRRGDIPQGRGLHRGDWLWRWILPVADGVHCVSRRFLVRNTECAERDGSLWSWLLLSPWLLGTTKLQPARGLLLPTQQPYC
jgi:hypothetical protein